MTDRCDRRMSVKAKTTSVTMTYCCTLGQWRWVCIDLGSYPLQGGAGSSGRRPARHLTRSFSFHLPTGYFGRAINWFPTEAALDLRQAPPKNAHWSDCELASSNGADSNWSKIMTKISLTRIAIAVSTFACAGLLSVGWSEQRGVSLSVDEAQARVGRPLTPVSVAGVARRQNR